MDKRIFIKKKLGFQVESDSLLNEIKENLKEKKLEEISIYNIYDIFNIDLDTLELLNKKVLSEPVTDEVFQELDWKDEKYLAMEFLPGQYDQRASSAMECLGILSDSEDIIIKSGKLLIFKGEIQDFDKIKTYLINPIEMREKNLEILCDRQDIEIEPVKEYIGFINLDEEELQDFLDKNSLAMTLEDLTAIQNYFKNIEQRNPSETEIKVLDTYWSDHCRHTTFETYLKNISIEKGEFQIEIQKSYEKYLSFKEELGRTEKPITLMDLGTIGAKYIKKLDLLEDIEDSNEINACSIEIDVDVDGKLERWLLMFKNETHNHPTEIEPFGGASTCVGGAIRDPLSGRAYVYQGMRISGAGDICEELEKTLENKLSQSKISKGAARGYSSYGNQIGLATTFVKEIYNEGYKAKRMEVGAVVGAVKKEYVRREEPKTGDLVVVLGGRTGRDGIGGATGSSKEHNENSLMKCSSEVQKGNAPEERKIQRLFRNPEVTKLIKKSNDFGAGGVSVAIGEIARGVSINLDKLKVKYLGLNGTELAISESQERMAVVIEEKDLELFLKMAMEESLEATVVATVTEEERLVITYKGKKIVDISREFLDTNGARVEQNVCVVESKNKSPFKKNIEISKENIENILISMNVSSQRGMVEMFDSTVGRSTVLMPYGGEYQLTESEASIQKIPTSGVTNTASILSFGYNPEIFEYSPYLGGIYSVIESLGRIVAVGGDYRKARLSFQEYFEKLGKNSEKWGKPFSALLGALEAQIEFKTPAIGGKDSMSGSFKEIHVPPTLISFAVVTENVENIISSEFKELGNYVYLIKNQSDEKNIPDYDSVRCNYDYIRAEIKNKKIVSAWVIKFGGILEAISKMSIGNMIGLEVNINENIFDILPGSMIVESKEKLSKGILLGVLNNRTNIKINSIEFKLNEIKDLLEKRYKKIYPCEMNCENLNKKLSGPENKNLKEEGTRINKAKKLYTNPKVLIVTFPGTNSEYDTEKAFKKAGGDVEIFVFNNLTVEERINSIRRLSEKIKNSQILALPGGFSGGDEPDGSGKFIANVLQNKVINESIKEFLKNEGLILGICNGFQGLIKSGLLPYGDIEQLNEKSPTLFRNDINRHISRMIKTKIISNSSPWLSTFKINEEHTLPISHGEGKFILSNELAKELFDNNQIALQYCEGDNLNGSSYSIEGIISKCGQIFGKMAHSERYEEGLFKNISGNKNQDIFANGINYFKK